MVRTTVAVPEHDRTTVIHIRDARSGDVYVGRPSGRLPDGVVLMTAFGNPFRLLREGSRPLVIEQYRRHLLASPRLIRMLPQLRGKRLACWCRPRRCHADVLVELLDRHTDAELRGMADEIEGAG